MSPSPSHSVMMVFIFLDGLAWHVSDRRNSLSFSTWLIHWAWLPKSHPCYHDIRMCSFLWLHITSISTYWSISIWIVYLLDLVFPWWTLRLVQLYNIVLVLPYIHHRYTCVPHPEPSSLLPPHTIPLGRPSAPAPSIRYRVSNLDWRLISYMILYIFQCHSPKSSHPLPLPQSPQDCSIHQCLFFYLVYRVIVTIFLNSIYMH